MSEEIKKDKIDPIGGQALIEGVMMRGKHKRAVAVRLPNGEIHVKSEPINDQKRHAIAKMPFIRGTVALWDAMVLGFKEIAYSAKMALSEEDKAKEEKQEQSIVGQIAILFSIIVGLAIAIGLFKVAPAFVFDSLKDKVHVFANAELNLFLLNFIEGLAKIAIFLVYLLLIAQMKDIKRLFQYHGAEHKAVTAHDKGLELTLENVRAQSTIHPRCGTAFMLVTFLVGVVVFMFLGYTHDVLTRVLWKVALFPVVAGISYELIMIANKVNTCENPSVGARIAYILTVPGLWFQQITTSEPDDAQMEVAIAALKGALVDVADDSLVESNDILAVE